MSISNHSAPEQAASDQATAGRPHPLRRVAGGLVGLVLVTAAGAAVAVSLIPAVTGATALTVLTGSMEPTLPVGSVAVVAPRSPDQIRPGDVITYTDRDPDSPATRIVTHRVVAVDQAPAGPSFRTQGDANDAPDQRPTAAADVHGVLWYSVPVVGWLRELLISPAGLLYLAGAALLLLAGHLALPTTR